MYYVYKMINNLYRLQGSYTTELQAKAKAKSVRGIIRIGGIDGQIMYDYRE